MISLLHPSRGRPVKSVDTIVKWTRNIGNVPYEVVVSLDQDDEQLEAYHALYSDFSLLRVLVNNNQDVVQATNIAARHSSGSVLIYVSDDFDCPEKWGEKIMALGHKGEWVLKVDDCLQRFNAPIITMPVMSRELYQRLGYFWHPDYKSMYVDNDLYYTCRRLGVIKEQPELKFQHNHYTFGRSAQDATYRRTESFYNQGKEVFEKRKRKAFDV